MKTDIEDEETVGLPGAVRRRISRLAKALKWKIYHLLFVTKQTKKKEKEKAKLIQSRVVTYVYNMIKKRLYLFIG